MLIRLVVGNSLIMVQNVSKRLSQKNIYEGYSRDEIIAEHSIRKEIANLEDLIKKNIKKSDLMYDSDEKIIIQEKIDKWQRRIQESNEELTSLLEER